MEYFDTFLEDKIPLKIVEIDEKEYDYIMCNDRLTWNFLKFLTKFIKNLKKHFQKNKRFYI